jgi:hypothetical protein
MKQETKTVEIEVNGKAFRRDFVATVFETVEDVISALSDPKQIVDILRNLNYGTDLKLRSVCRAALVSESAGPDKAIERLVADLIKMRAAIGKPISEEQARNLVTQMQ